MQHQPNPTSQPVPAGGRLVTTDGRELPLRATHLAAKARAGLARTVLRQTFRNPYDEPLAVRYQVPLPADGAVSGYAFRLGDETIVGRVDTKERARDRFEDAILEGKSAALLEQDRSSLFTQELGNVPPGAEVEAEVVVDHPLAWLAEGAWEWRFPTVVAPRYVNDTVPDAGRIAVDVADGPIGPRCSLELAVVGVDGAKPSSPTHAVSVHQHAATATVTLEAATLDRDVAVSWPAARPEVGAELVVARPEAGHARDGDAFGLLTVVPPRTSSGHHRRDLVLLLDTSGSMHGSPLDQARRVALALVDTLGPDDTLEMISFGARPVPWKAKPVAATDAHKRDASAWLRSLQARGGTEMRSGILAALRPTRNETSRQIVLVTDGLIGFEHEIVRTLLDELPPACRVHTVGVGPAVNRTLTQSAARAGRGQEVLIGLGDDPEKACRRLVAHTARPVVVDVKVEGSALVAQAPQRIPDLYEGAPMRLSLQLKPQGGELVVRGRRAGETYEERLQIGPVSLGEGGMEVVRRFAREAVEDLEAERGRHRDVDAQIERLGLDFQIATRLTSWIAVSAKATVDPTAPTRRETVPQALPYGMSAEGLGLRPASAMMPIVQSQSFGALADAPVAAAAPGGAPGRSTPVGRGDEARKGRGVMDRIRGLLRSRPGPEREKTEGPTSPPAAAPAPAPMPPASRGPLPPPGSAPPPPRGAGAPPTMGDDTSAEGSAPPQLPTLLLSARLVRDRDGTLVVEVTLPQGLEWSPGSFEVETATGRTAATLDAATSTAPGSYGAGTVLRLVLQVQGGAGSPVAIWLHNGGRPVVLRLGAR